MPQTDSRKDIIRHMPPTARLLLALCRKDVEPAMYANGSLHAPAHSQHPLQQLTNAYPQFREVLRDKAVLDFGCAEGEQARAMIDCGARAVHGIDINTAAISVAKQRSSGISGLTFSDRVPDNVRYDIILSQNSFEHFTDAASILQNMAAALAPGGKIFVTFGPTWYSPWGAHVEFFCRIPWVHLLFSESTITNVRRVYRSDGCTNFTEMGLAQMSLKKFQQLVSAAGFHIEYSRLDCVNGWNFLRLTPLRELFINQISCILSRA